MRILLVEDNEDLALWLARVLERENYGVDRVADGADADQALRLHRYALVILDLSLPELGGLEVLKRLRARGDTVPVIILTANASLEGRIAGLDHGADDYLAKPFEVSELEARIRAQLRRAHGQKSPLVACDGLVLDTNSRRFTLSGELLVLTPREHAVLEKLLLEACRTVSKAALAESVYGLGDEADPNAVEIYVHRVRKKLEGGDVQIVTLRGLGYLLQPRAHHG
jgi:two-component system response regulator TctD